MIELFVGPMFAGKTEALIHEIRICKDSYEVFKPSCDTRDSISNVVSHDKSEVPAVPVQTAGDILRLCGNAKAVFIDEVQFFGPAILSVCRTLEDRNIRVVCSGLDMDSNRLPFGCIGDLMAMASSVHKLKAICSVCGHPAVYSFRKVPVKDRIFVGGDGQYTALCGECWEVAHG